MDPVVQGELVVAARHFAKKLEASKLQGPKTDATKLYLKLLEERFGAKIPAQEAIKRKAHKPPVGMFAKRERIIKLGKHNVKVTSITQAERALYDLGQGTTTEIAAAIKAAYPENNYTEQRYISASKKFNRETKMTDVEDVVEVDEEE